MGIMDVDPSFEQQAQQQRGGTPTPPATDNPFGVAPHFSTRPVTHEEVLRREGSLEPFFALAGPGSAVKEAPPMPPWPHFSLRPEFEALAERSGPFSILKNR